MTGEQVERYPLRGIGKRLAAALTVLGGTVGALATVGAITAEQDTAVRALLAAVAALLPAVTAVVTAFGVVRAGEEVVTPVADPRDDAGHALKAVPSAGGTASQSP
ncbi:hypothetical protein KCV87_32115 [Actinosynnema pretiosum subsp. pretiosum]|uniref:Uncharacterized protein n=1 Tax=Actinosynnema pretiosum subsp. pretiosum TaxID=103721 RepID=A0AA45L693_9PSEU|nr:hypothetical protein APASM_4716 [Actinosynnema pretiosum subsp. pretiosum]QUF03950.1 hypothetical protein KCV87_32115 [Actinosynnema pretiosum subsp. pretiosum]